MSYEYERIPTTDDKQQVYAVQVPRGVDKESVIACINSYIDACVHYEKSCKQNVETFCHMKPIAFKKQIMIYPVFNVVNSTVSLYLGPKCTKPLQVTVPVTFETPRQKSVSIRNGRNIASAIHRGLAPSSRCSWLKNLL